MNVHEWHLMRDETDSLEQELADLSDEPRRTLDEIARNVEEAALLAREVDLLGREHLAGRMLFSMIVLDAFAVLLFFGVLGGLS